VTVAGSSVDGWIAAEIALLGSPRVASVVLDAAGLQLEDHPAADFFSLTMAQVAELSYYHPDAFRIDLDSLPAPAKAMVAGNRAALATYGGTAMADPALGTCPSSGPRGSACGGPGLRPGPRLAPRRALRRRGKAVAAALPTPEGPPLNADRRRS
jgi:pimeloyl-ACP methyl ester carboxylesterase